MQMTVCIVGSIQLTALPLEASLLANITSLSPAGLESETKYCPCISSKSPTDLPSITYTLYTNPVLCHRAPYEVHQRELGKIHRNSWTIQDLKDANMDAFGSFS